MKKWYYWRPWLIILVGIGLLLFAIRQFHIKEPINIITVAGTCASIIGIAITIAQVSSIQKEVKKNSDAIRTLHSISSFRQASGWISTILNAITLKEYGLAHSKTTDLVSFLVEQKTNKQVSCKEDWDNCINSLTIDSQSLYRKMNDNNYTIQIIEISKDLENARKLMATVSGTLENNSYDTGNNQ